MYRYLLTLAFASVLLGCDSGSPIESSACNVGSGDQPLVDESCAEPEEAEEEEPVVEEPYTVATLPLTDETAADPSPDAGISRKEAKTETTGDGFANSITYNANDNTFFVEGVDFDGDQPGGTNYGPSGTFATVGGFNLYEAPVTVSDPVSGNPIAQNETLAIYGENASGDSRFAIVRTGSYFNYGFGGFIYERDGEVVLPTEGQAIYRGGYAGLVDFDGRSGIRIVEGDATVQIDVGAFSGNCEPAPCDNAVSGWIENRTYYAPDGTNVTADVITEIDDDATDIPVLIFTRGPDSMDGNGEMTNEIVSVFDGSVYESGNYYAMMSGDHTTGGEIVGIVVVTATDGSVTKRETGGFIVAR